MALTEQETSKFVQAEPFRLHYHSNGSNPSRGIFRELSPLLNGKHKEFITQEDKFDVRFPIDFCRFSFC